MTIATDLDRPCVPVLAIEGTARFTCESYMGHSAAAGPDASRHTVDLDGFELRWIDPDDGRTDGTMVRAALIDALAELASLLPDRPAVR